MADAVMVTSSFLPGRGGIESYLAELCGQLSPHLAVLAPARREGRTLPRELGYPVAALPSLPLPGKRSLAAIVATAERHGTKRVLFGTPWPLALLGPSLRRRGFRYACVVHGAELMVPAAIPGARRALARSLASADIILTVSAFTARRTRTLLQAQHLAPPPIEPLRPRVDVGRFHPEVDVRSVRERLGLGHRKLVLCFGRLVRRKGVHRLIDALPQLARRVPEVALVVGGTGPEERRLRRLAGRRAGEVVFAGRVPVEDAPALYAAADVFALPVADRWFGLDVEGFGVVLLEAAACGTPSVTGRSGGTPEAVVDGRTGFVIDARDQQILVEKIAWLLEHPAAAAEMGAAARALAVSEFSRERLPEVLSQWLR
jgi:phosphatidylinositol alpha-1,6-mannosyltransferase